MYIYIYFYISLVRPAILLNRFPKERSNMPTGQGVTNNMCSILGEIINILITNLNFLGE